MAKLLIDNGAEVNAKSTLDATALLLAVVRGACITMAINLRQNTNGKLYSLHFLGHFEVAKLLIDNGAEVDARSKSNVTALMLASHKGAHITTIELNL